MERIAYRDDGGDDGDGADQPDAYWRRRVITLALGLGLLGMLAWGVSGGGGKPAPASTSVVPPATALDTAIPGLAAGGPATPVSASASVSPGPSSLATGSGTSSATHGNASAPPSATRPPATAGLGASPRANAGPGGHCVPGSVVLSLFTDRTSYRPAQYPRFAVYAVSTSAGSCAFDPGQLQVVVLSAGRIVWDSADCVRGGGRVAQLARGVPAQDAVIWNRAITLPGCQVLALSARPGTYTVQARTATVQSPVRTFKLTS